MKSFAKITSFVLLLLVFGNTSFAYSETSYYENWEIKSFHTDITIHENRDIDVTETIVADFANEAHKGIARVIPNNDNGDLTFKNATNENGKEWLTTTYDENNSLNIEMINWSDKPTNDTNTFIIKYIAENVITSFDTDTNYKHDELYWNINGTDWPVKTNEVTAEIHLPKKIPSSEIKLECYTGAFGEAEKNCSWEQKDEQTISFKATKPFSAYENLTVVVGMPIGTVIKMTESEKMWQYIKRNFGFFIPFLTLFIMIWLWHTRGRDEKTLKTTIMPHYKPPEGLLPTETGTIIDEKIHPQDITATIIDFAIKGYIKINEIEKPGFFGKSTDYELELTKQYKTTKEFEKQIMEGIFSENKTGSKKKVSELENKFFKYIPKIKSSVMNQLVIDGYFPHSPQKIRTIYGSIGGAMIVIPAQFASLIPGSATAGLIISGIIIAIIGQFLPRKTKKGTETYYVLKGLYEYINTAEKDRMQFQEQNNILFEKLLPYAISFGLVKKWATAFEGILNTPPNWYYPAHGWANHFTMMHFANTLSSMNGKLTTNITSRPGGRGGSGFGGGGFSGGGGGGGGGHGL